MGSQSKEFPSLLFTPKTTEKAAEGYRSRSPHSTRSPSISAYGRNSIPREASVSRRRSLTPPASLRDTPPPPPPASSLLDSLTGAGTPSALSDIRGDSTLPLQPEESTSYSEASDDTWVTVYGFAPEDRHTVLKELSACGEILHFGSGREDRVNWMHVKFASPYQAQKALLKNGRILNSRLMVGVKRLDDRHRAAAESLNLAAPLPAVRAAVKPVSIRPYKLDGPAMQGLVSAQSASWWTKVNELVFGA